MRYREFVDYLIKGNKQAASKKFSNLVLWILQLEDIYTSILLPAYWGIRHLVEDNTISDNAYHESTSILMVLLDQVEQEILKLNDYKFNTLIIIEEEVKSTVPVKIVRSLLQIEHVFPLVMSPPLRLMIYIVT